MKGNKKEIRNLKFRELRAEVGANGERVFSGYAAPFNSRSVDLGGFVEVIAPVAFNRTLREQPDVYALYAHDMRTILGRTRSGTLTLNADDKGLAFRCTAPNTAAARDLATLVERGDIDGCSFGFYTRDDSWVEDANGVLVRTLLDVDLDEISITPFEAYPATSVSVRSAPREMRAKLNTRAVAECECECPECQEGDCENCSDPECNDPECRCQRTRRAPAAGAVRAIRAAGNEDTARQFEALLTLAWKVQTDCQEIIQGIAGAVADPAAALSGCRDELQEIAKAVAAGLEGLPGASAEAEDEEARTWKQRAEMRIKLAQHTVTAPAQGE